MHAHDQPLSTVQLTRVLDRLGVSAPRLSLEGLAEVYRAWCRSVPFDNTRKLIHLTAGDAGVLPGDNPVEFFDAWLRWGSGGTCWAGNGALCVLLRTLGFDTERGIATMMIAPGLPPNHGTVLVRIGDRRYLVDASMLYSQPLSLEDAASTSVEHPAWGVRCEKRDEHWQVLWQPLHTANALACRIDRAGAGADEFSGLHEATRAWSPFNYAANVRLNVGDRVVGLAFGHYVRIDANGEMTRNEVDDTERRRVLVEEIGLHPELVERVPGDRPTPPIPTSRTAAAARQEPPAAALRPYEGD